MFMPCIDKYAGSIKQLTEVRKRCNLSSTYREVNDPFYICSVQSTFLIVVAPGIGQTFTMPFKLEMFSFDLSYSENKNNNTVLFCFFFSNFNFSLI